MAEEGMSRGQGQTLINLIREQNRILDDINGKFDTVMNMSRQTKNDIEFIANHLNLERGSDGQLRVA